MEIQQSIGKHKGSFFIEQNSKKEAVIAFDLSSDNILKINHTIVNDSFAGKGVGKQLVNKTVEFARENNFKINPVCSFANKILQNEKYKDIVAQL